jgi:hypothetical protein
MRTLFEDTNLRAELEDGVKDSGNRYLLVVLWFVAIAFLGGTWGVYRWANSRPAPPPPPPPVSLQDLKQVSTAYSTFNGFVRDGKWTEAEAMLSTVARQQLSAENKTLQDSLLGKLKALKLTGAEGTPSIDRTDPNTFRQDFVYVFTDETFTKSEQKIISLALVIENGKIVVNSWADPKQEEKKDEKKADAKKA